MSWGCNAGNTRQTTLAAEEEAAAAGTQLNNATLLALLLGQLTVGVDHSPTAVDATWPDEEHIDLARHAIENPYLMVPDPKNADHALCVECGIFAASTSVVPAPGSVPEWPACRGMFPLTHCRSCATADGTKDYIFDAASCGCGASRGSSGGRLICHACCIGNNEVRVCSTVGCDKKRTKK